MAEPRKRTAHSLEISRESSARSKAENRARVNALKEAAQCADCPSFVRWPAVALSFDHLPGEEKFREVSKMMSRKWADIEAEMAKCQVICHNHHAIRTARRGGWPGASKLEP